MPGAIAHALQHVVFVIGDYILRQGTRPTGMYFLSSGTVEVVTTKQEDGNTSTLKLPSREQQSSPEQPCYHGTLDLGCPPLSIGASEPLGFLPGAVLWE